MPIKLITRCAFGLSVCTAVIFAARCEAEFVKQAEFPVQNGAFGIAFDGTQWHISTEASHQWVNYDANFNFLSTTTAIGVVGFRGIDYNPGSRHIISVDYDANRIRENALNGAAGLSWTPSGVSLPNDIAADPRDASVWYCEFGGIVQHKTFSGAPISSFDTGMNLTGITLDTRHDTLLVLQSGDLPTNDDRLYEYTTSGVLVGQLMDDQIAGNGLALSYNADTGKLYVTSDPNDGTGNGTVTVFQDVSRIPEPALVGPVLGMALLLRRQQAGKAPKKRCQGRRKGVRMNGIHFTFPPYK
jgi:hypothetical protein